MEITNHSFVQGLSTEELNGILSKNPKENERLYEALKKENEQKKQAFLSDLRARISKSKPNQNPFPPKTAD
jgi:hypothetical protein